MRREVLVGAVILLGAGVTVVGTLFLKGTDLSRTTREVVALSAEAGQLMSGSSVKLRGVEVGKVEGISVEPSGEAVRIEMRIHSDLRLPQTAGVVLAPESMFGDWQVEIVDRTAYPRLAFPEGLPPEVLPGYALPDISRLTQTADEIAQNLTTITDRVELAFTEETALNLKEAIDNIQAVSRGLAALVDQQASTFERVTSEIESSAQDIGNAARSAEATFGLIQGVLVEDSLAANTQEVVMNLRAASERLLTSADQLDATLLSAQSSFDRFDRIGANLEAGQGALGHLLSDSTFALRAESVMAQLDLLLEDLRANPKKYVRLSIF